MSPQPETTQQDHAVVAKYLLEAHGKECQLETALEGQVALAQSPPVQHALRDHLGVTRRQIGALERRIDELGGAPSQGFGVVDTVVESVVELTGSVVNRGLALAKLPLQALRGTSPADNELRSLRDCYWNEAEEIAHYRVIETLANELGDTETAELAARHRAEEEAMQRTLEDLIPGAVRGVVASEASSDAPEAPTAQATAAAEAKPSEPTSSAAPSAAAPKAKASKATKPGGSASAAESNGEAAKPAGRVKKATSKSASAPKRKPQLKPVADGPDLAEPQASTSELLDRALAPKPIPGQPPETPVAPTAAELATAPIADSDATPESASAAEPKAEAAKPAGRVKKATPKSAAAPKSKPKLKPVADAPDLAEPHASTSELLDRALAPKPIPGQPPETPVPPTAAELATAAIADSDATPEA